MVNRQRIMDWHLILKIYQLYGLLILKEYKEFYLTLRVLPYCGFYCVLFLLFMTRKKIDQFFKKFDTDLYNNDKFIETNIKNFE